jgi:hypothetical protein
MSMATRTHPQPLARQVADNHDLVRVRGARENNLKDVSLELPNRKRNLGVLLGARVIFAGRNTAPTITPAVNFVH